MFVDKKLSASMSTPDKENEDIFIVLKLSFQGKSLALKGLIPSPTNSSTLFQFKR